MHHRHKHATSVATQLSQEYDEELTEGALLSSNVPNSLTEFFNAEKQKTLFSFHSQKNITCGFKL